MLNVNVKGSTKVFVTDSGNEAEIKKNWEALNINKKITILIDKNRF